MSVRMEIIRAFKAMVLDKNTKISVSMICNKVNISRKTFYKYFLDIEDLISTIIHEEIFVSLEEISTMHHLKVEDSITVLNSMYSKIYDERTFYTNLYYLFDKDYIFKKCWYNELQKLNNQILKTAHKNEIEAEYHVHLAAMSGLALIEKWIDDDFTLTSREISEIFYKYVVRAWVELIDAYR